MFFACLFLSLSIFGVFGAGPSEGIDFESPVGIDVGYRDTFIWIPPDDKQIPVVPHGPDIFIMNDGEGNALLQIPESYRVSLQNAVGEAARVCAGSAKLRKRDLVGCMINQAEAYVQDDSVIQLLDPRQLRKFRLQIRRGQQKFLELSRRFKELVDLNRALLFMGAAFETQTVGWTAGAIVLSGGAIVPLGEFMKFMPVDDDGDEEEFPEQGTTFLPLPTETPTGCRPTQTDDFPTDCADDDCQGQEQKVCTTGPENGCPCENYGRWIEDEYDTKFGDEQQKLFKKVNAEAPMGCSFGTLGEYEGGKAVMEPSAWCVCSTGSTTAYYPTRSETGDAACAYTSMPKETISPEQNPPPGTATEEPSCFPTYGSDPKKDQLLKICDATDTQLAWLCTQEGHDFTSAECNIPANLFDPNNHDYENFHPILKSTYQVFFDLDENAPEKCKSLFTKDADDGVVESRCLPALQAIKEKCPWNGGVAWNECGRFVYQTCKRDSEGKERECEAGKLE